MESTPHSHTHAYKKVDLEYYVGCILSNNKKKQTSIDSKKFKGPITLSTTLCDLLHYIRTEQKVLDQRKPRAHRTLTIICMQCTHILTCSHSKMRKGHKKNLNHSNFVKFSKNSQCIKNWNTIQLIFHIQFPFHNYFITLFNDSTVWFFFASHLVTEKKYITKLLLSMDLLTRKKTVCMTKKNAVKALETYKNYFADNSQYTCTIISLLLLFLAL